ncbi:MAG: DUF4123 domain-containing protein [Acidobacteriota bacterium]
MDRQELRKHLITNTTRLYGVFDGASVPNLPMRLYEARIPNFCLFSGDLEPDMVYVAPYVVRLSPDSKFTDWVIDEGFGKHWGIFVHSAKPLPEMRRHFRDLVNVYDEKANSMVFRFYDPRVLRKFLPVCTPDELKVLFGDVENFFAEDETGEKLLSFSLENGDLKTSELDQ